MQEQADKAAQSLSALAEPHRLLIMRQLRRGPRTAGYLARALGIAPSLASHHLSALTAAGLARRRRVGNSVCYSLEWSRVRDLHERVGRLVGASGAVAEQGAPLPDEPC